MQRRLGVFLEHKYRGRPRDTSLDDLPTFRGVFFLREAVTSFVQRCGFEGYPFLFASDIFALVITVLTVELSIWVNGVKGVNQLDSSGQLIAFIVGLGSFANAIWAIYHATARPQIVRSAISH